MSRTLSRHALLCAASLVMLYPLLWLLGSSLKPNADIFGTVSILPNPFDFSGYQRGWHGLQVSFGHFQWNSLVIATLSVIGNVMSCSLAAFAFSRLNFPMRGFWLALMLGSLMVPYHITLIPQYLLFRQLDWINTILPLVAPKFLATDAFFIFLMVQFFRGIPRALDEAAMLDGYGTWGIYWRIVLPLSRPVLATAAVFTFIWTWDDFLGPLIYLSEVPAFTAQIALRTFVDAGGNSDWAALFAMSVVNILPVFLLFVFFQRTLVDGIAASGLKR